MKRETTYPTQELTNLTQFKLTEPTQVSGGGCRHAYQYFYNAYVDWFYNPTSYNQQRMNGMYQNYTNCHNK